MTAYANMEMAMAHAEWIFHKHLFLRISNLLTASKSSCLILKDLIPKIYYFSHFGAQTIDFLDKLRPLLTNVELVKCDIPADCLENFRTILTTLAPMLDGIRSLGCQNESAFTMLKEHLFCEDEKLAKLKYFDINISKIGSEEIAGFLHIKNI